MKYSFWYGTEMPITADSDRVGIMEEGGGIVKATITQIYRAMEARKPLIIARDKIDEKRDPPVATAEIINTGLVRRITIDLS